jgi:hypothetical protein
MPDHLIWSEEHGAWWRAGSRGYTVSMREAGRYTRAEADQICRSANIGGFFQEVPVLISLEMATACERQRR